MSRSQSCLQLYGIGIVPSSMYLGTACYIEGKVYKIPAWKTLSAFVISSALYPLTFSYAMYKYDLDLPGSY
nr:putative membrane protein [Cedratvirus lena]